MTTTPATIIAPPFTLESAIRKVRLAEDAWNSRDPAQVVLAYSEDSVWRNRIEFPIGREQIRRFLAGKWERELDYRLVKCLWVFATDRIAVKFEYEWHDHAGDWFRSYGNELWEFDERGLMPPGSEHQRPPNSGGGSQVLWPAPAPSRRITQGSSDPALEPRRAIISRGKRASHDRIRRLDQLANRAGFRSENGNVERNTVAW